MEGEGWGGKGKEGGKRKRRMTAIANFLGPARIQPKALFHDAERDLLATAKFFLLKLNSTKFSVNTQFFKR